MYGMGLMLRLHEYKKYFIVIQKLYLSNSILADCRLMPLLTIAAC